MKIAEKTVKIIFFSLFMAGNSWLSADNRIILHLRHANPKDRKAVLKKYKTPNKTPIGKKAQTLSQLKSTIEKNGISKYLTPKLSGFICTYGGYTDISDPDGSISFPLRHVSTKIYIAITARIKLIKIKGDTISHKEFDISKENPLKYYLFEKKEDEKKQPFWDVKAIEPPKDKKINSITLIIFSNPKNIVINEGHFIASKNPQLILPDLFVVGSINKEKVLLQNLNIKRYFEPIIIQEKKVGDTVIQKNIKNI